MGQQWLNRCGLHQQMRCSSRECSVRRLVSSLSALVALLGCERYELDRQMEELCKIDGGVKVFEHITLPASRFDERGQVKPVLTTEQDAVDPRGRYGTDFKLVSVTTLLKSGDPLKGQGKLTRTEHQIVRVADGKVLSIAVTYSRVGGDTVLLGQPSTNHCPMRGQGQSVESVFVKEN